MKNEADEVYKQIEKVKQKAKDMGIFELFEKLYFNNIRHYHSWISRNRDYVPSLVTEAAPLEKGKENQERYEKVSIDLSGRNYLFTFKEKWIFAPDGDAKHGLLQLFYNDQRVLALNVAYEDNEFFGEWKAFNLEAFIEGDWINDFKALERQIETNRKERERRERENPEKINKLKNDFGIN